MKKFYLLILLGVLFSWSGLAAGQSDVMKDEYKLSLIQSIETGDLDWTSFVNAIKTRQITFEDVSPSAVANYLEAFANEGLMALIPYDYFNNEEFKTSLDVVFEDPSNICSNPNVYANHLE